MIAISTNSHVIFTRPAASVRRSRDRYNRQTVEVIERMDAPRPETFIHVDAV